MDVIRLHGDILMITRIILQDMQIESLYYIPKTNITNILCQLCLNKKRNKQTRENIMDMKESQLKSNIRLAMSLE